MKRLTEFGFLLLLVVFLASCEKEPSKPVGKLEELEILGTWEINAQTINGITDMSVLCCEFTEFMEDQDLNDHKGNYRTYGNGHESAGVFEIDPNNARILWGETNTQAYNYELQANQLRVSYVQENTSYELVYLRID